MPEAKVEISLPGMKLPPIPKLPFLPLIGVVAAATIAVVSLGTGVYFYQRAQKAEAIIKDPQKLGKEEGKRLIDSLRKLMEIPADEDPAIATVADAGKLKDQPFFANSQNGDKVIVYTKSRKAILYRPSTNKIIDVAPVSIGDANANQPARASQEPPKPQIAGTVLILNGTMTSGITKKVEDAVRSAFPALTIVDRDNAKGRAYGKTIVVDVKGTHQEAARTIAQEIQGSLSSLPEGEATPAADILIIVGEDRK